MSSRKAGLGFILVTLFLDILGIGLIIPVLPRLLKDFMHGDDAAAARWLGLIAAAYTLMQFLCAPLIGGLSDRFGRRPVLLLTNLAQGIDYLVMAFAPSVWWLFVGRIVAGITGASISAATAYIADVSPPEKRSANFGLIGAAFGLGFILGPALGGLLGDGDLRRPFLVAAALTTGNALYGFFVLPESLSKEHRRHFAWRQANPVGTLMSLTRYPLVLSLIISMVFAFLAHRALESTWVLYTLHRFAWRTRDTGLSLAVVGVAAAVVQGGLARRLIPALGERRTLVLSLVIAAVAHLLYGLASAGWMMLAIIPLGSFAGLGGPASQGIMSKALPPNEQGLLQGGLASLQSMTGFVGTLVATRLFSYSITEGSALRSPGLVFFYASVLSLLGLAGVILTFRKYRPEATAPEATRPTPVTPG